MYVTGRIEDGLSLEELKIRTKISNYNAPLRVLKIFNEKWQNRGWAFLRGIEDSHENIQL